MENNPSPTNEEKENMEKRKGELQTILKDQSDHVKHLQTSAFTLANYYFVFQGVILGGIAKVRCSNRWFFFSLSLIAAILNLFSLIVIGENYKRSLKHRRTTIGEIDRLESAQAKQKYSHNSEQSTSAPTQLQEAAPQDSGSQKQASQDQQVAPQDPESARFPTVDKYKNLLHDIYFQICICLFVSFAIIVLVGCLTIPCRKARHSKHPSEKCIRLCEGTKCISICTQH